LAKLAGRHPSFHFDGFLPNQSDCLAWAQKVDVLINVRLPFWGQENSIPSKVFDYGAAGKAVLTTRTAGIDAVLGNEGLYIETDNFEDSLRQRLQEISTLDRPELQRRARVIRNRMVNEFSCDEQARRLFEFLAGIENARSSKRSSAG
jgi:glycosyltransferase involved in cell wall biosynthesis